MVQLENLQLAANTTTMAVNARGPFINARLHDILVRVQKIAFHGARHGVSVALAMAQV